MNPDCRDGKHDACNGDGWDHDTDEPVPCPCDCHRPGPLPAGHVWFAPVGTSPEDLKVIPNVGSITFDPTPAPDPPPAWGSETMTATIQFEDGRGLFEVIEHARRIAVLKDLGLAASALNGIEQAARNFGISFDRCVEAIGRIAATPTRTVDGLGRVLCLWPNRLDTDSWWPSPCRGGDRGGP